MYGCKWVIGLGDDTLVLLKSSNAAYKLEFSTKAKIHPIFHVSVLKHCFGEPIQQVTPLQLQDCPNWSRMDDFNLGDKLNFQEGFNVVNSVDTCATHDKDDSTRDFHIAKPRPSTRNVIPPKRLDCSFLSERNSRGQG